MHGYRSEFLKGFVNKHKTGFLPQNFVFNGQLHFSSHVESNLVKCKSDVWLTVNRNSVWIRKTN